jgi:hypothetical protein
VWRLVSKIKPRQLRTQDRASTYFRFARMLQNGGELAVMVAPPSNPHNQRTFTDRLTPARFARLKTLSYRPY